MVLAVAASLAAVLALRVAARWRPDTRWGVAVRSAAGDVAGDPGGSALLWLATAVSAAVAGLVPVTVLLLGGVLALAAVAVDTRTHRG